MVTVVFKHLEVLCQTQGLQPNSQSISNSLLACAELGLDVEPTCIEVLLKHFMEMHVVDVSYQDCCNIAWSLAVMQCLDLNTFEALLDKRTGKHTLAVQESGPQSASAQLHLAKINQLHQAMAWLRPPSGSKQMKAWSSLQARLLAVALELAAETVFVPGQNLMWAALAIQEVPHKAQVKCGVYWADALLSPCDQGVAKVILMIEGPTDHLTNMPSRYCICTTNMEGCMPCGKCHVLCVSKAGLSPWVLPLCMQMQI